MGVEALDLEALPHGHSCGRQMREASHPLCAPYTENVFSLPFP
jgi:hypothetical protein